MRHRLLTGVVSLRLLAQKVRVGVLHRVRLVHELVRAVHVEHAESTVLARQSEKLSAGRVPQRGDGRPVRGVLRHRDGRSLDVIDDDHRATEGADGDVVAPLRRMPRHRTPLGGQPRLSKHALLLERPHADGSVLAHGGEDGKLGVRREVPHVALVEARARIDGAAVALHGESRRLGRRLLLLPRVAHDVDGKLENLGRGETHGEGATVGGGRHSLDGGGLARLVRPGRPVFVEERLRHLGHGELKLGLHEHAPELHLAILTGRHQALPGEAHVVDRAVVQVPELAHRAAAALLVLVHVALRRPAEGGPVRKKREREHRTLRVSLPRAVRVHRGSHAKRVAVHLVKLERQFTADDQSTVRGVILHHVGRVAAELLRRDNCPRKVRSAEVIHHVRGLRVGLPLVHAHGVFLVRAHGGEEASVGGEGEVERGGAVRGEDGGDAFAVDGLPDVDR